MINIECCATCKWSRDGDNDECVKCVNINSPNVLCWISKDEWCEEYKEKERVEV